MYSSLISDIHKSDNDVVDVIDSDHVIIYNSKGYKECVQLKIIENNHLFVIEMHI